MENVRWMFRANNRFEKPKESFKRAQNECGDWELWDSLWMNHGDLKTEGRKEWKVGLSHVVEDTEFNVEEAAFTLAFKRDLLVGFETPNNM